MHLTDDDRELLIMGLNLVIKHVADERKAIAVTLARSLPLVVKATDQAFDRIADDALHLIDKLNTAESAVAFVPPAVYATETQPMAEVRPRGLRAALTGG